MKCSIYARYSSDMQREESIQDQIRKCKKFAKRKGWNVLEDHIYSDEAKSGASINGRTAFQKMVDVACQKPKPFDYILVDDTKRFARDVITLKQIHKKVEQEHSNIKKAIAYGILTDTTKAMLLEIEEKKREILEQLVSVPKKVNPVLVLPGKVESYLKSLTKLLSKHPLKARDLVRRVIERVEMVSVIRKNNARLKARIFGKVTGILELTNYQSSIKSISTKAGCGGGI